MSCDDAMVTYEIPITYYENEFRFDQATVFKLHGKPQRLNGELANMLRMSRYAENFKFDPVDEKTQTLETDNQLPSSEPPSSACCSRKQCC